MNKLKSSRIINQLKSLGPGLLWAGAAIGVSHLVQSTRAGANYGFALVWALLLANLFKYPAFEFGPRYARPSVRWTANDNRLGREIFTSLNPQYLSINKECYINTNLIILSNSLI